jgi:hypothetical protein
MLDVMPQAPDRSLEQRMAALERANRIRFARAQWKREAKHSVADRRKPLESEEFATMKAIDYLMALPMVGRTKANKILANCRISASKTLGGLTQRQRDELLSYIVPYVRR